MVELVAYDSSWPTGFRRAAGQLRAILGAEWVIEHIGSTSIPGMSAKPIIDLALRTPDAETLSQHRPALADAGWFPIRRQPRDHQVVVRERDGRRTHIAHIFDGSSWESCHQRVFRDWLIENPADRDLYEATKLEAAADPNYADRKRPVILTIVNRALAARGWPLIDDLDQQ